MCVAYKLPVPAPGKEGQGHQDSNQYFGAKLQRTPLFFFSRHRVRERDQRHLQRRTVGSGLHQWGFISFFKAKPVFIFFLLLFYHQLTSVCLISMPCTSSISQRSSPSSNPHSNCFSPPLTLTLHLGFLPALPCQLRILYNPNLYSIIPFPNNCPSLLPQPSSSSLPSSFPSTSNATPSSLFLPSSFSSPLPPAPPPLH